MRRGLLLACVVVLSVAGCGGSGGGADEASGSGTVGDAPPAATSAPASNPGTGTPPPPAATTAASQPLTCAQLANATVGTAAVRLADYDAGVIQLSGGTYTGPGGVVALQSQCATGDLNGDGIGDAIGVVKITAGGTGQFYTLVVWTSNGSGVPQLAATKAIGDRNPVTDLSIAGGKATVVYLTRTPDVPMAGVNLKRTAIFQLSGGSLTEISHTDVAYTP